MFIPESYASLLSLSFFHLIDHINFSCHCQCWNICEQPFHKNLLVLIVFCNSKASKKIKFRK